MPAIQVNNSHTVIVLNGTAAIVTFLTLQALRGKETQLKAANAAHRLGLGHNQVEDLTDAAKQTFIGHDDLLVLTGDLAASYNSFLYVIKGHPEMLQELGVSNPQSYELLMELHNALRR